MSITNSRIGYRIALKAARKAFRGDEFAQKSAQQHLRGEFLKKKDVTDVFELKKLHEGIEELVEMLTFNIVQGVRNERGNYGVKLHNPEHLATIESRQSNPLGAEIEMIDESSLGQGVKVEKTKGNKNLKINIDEELARD